MTMPRDPGLAALLQRYRTHPDFLGLALADLNQRGAVDDAMLHIAARRGALDDIEVLLNSGADVNASGDLGFTPLHCAAMKGRVEVARRLLAAGADRMATNEWGDTPGDTAVKGGHADLARLIGGQRRRR